MSWMTKHAYANKIGCSTKSVERKLAAGRLASYCAADGKRLVWAQPEEETGLDRIEEMLVERLAAIEAKLDQILVKAPAPAPASKAQEKNEFTLWAAALTAQREDDITLLRDWAKNFSEPNEPKPLVRDGATYYQVGRNATHSFFAGIDLDTGKLYRASDDTELGEDWLAGEVQSWSGGYYGHL